MYAFAKINDTFGQKIVRQLSLGSSFFSKVIVESGDHQFHRVPCCNLYLKRFLKRPVKMGALFFDLDKLHVEVIYRLSDSFSKEITKVYEYDLSYANPCLTDSVVKLFE